MASTGPSSRGILEAKSKKRRSGFKVGPDNLPDGTYRRKGTDQINKINSIAIFPFKGNQTLRYQQL